MTIAKGSHSTVFRVKQCAQNASAILQDLKQAGKRITDNKR